MRFHMGVSFSLRTIKKYIFPILLGILAYFGLNFLGLGIIHVKALENYDTSYTLSYSELEVLDTKIDDNLTYNEFFTYLNSLESQHYNLIIGINFYKDSITNYNVGLIRLQLMPINVASCSVSLYGTTSYPSGFKFQPYNCDSARFYTIVINGNTYTDILQDSVYSSFLNCLQNNSCSNSGGSALDNSYQFAHFDSNSFDNDSSFVGTFPYFSNSFSNNTVNSYSLLYSSKVPFYYSVNSNSSDSKVFYKKIIINDKELEVGDYIPTYKEYLDSLTPDPEPEPEPDDTEHKAIFNKVYWFDDNTTEIGILSSIYILLFLYCITMVFFKIATLLKNKRW